MGSETVVRPPKRAPSGPSRLNRRSARRTPQRATLGRDAVRPGAVVPPTRWPAKRRALRKEPRLRKLNQSCAPLGPQQSVFQKKDDIAKCFTKIHDRHTWTCGVACEAVQFPGG